jgi:predicted phosphate transport protein (TIGR00153 family)
MFGGLKGRSKEFFELFNAHAEQAVLAARELAALMTSGGEFERRIFEIESIEKRADEIAHTAIDLLHRSFITPLDRIDIHRLVSRLDDIVDLIEDTSQSIHVYHVTAITPECRRLCEICVACTEKVRSAVSMLSDMSNAQAIFIVCQDIDRLESEADHVMRAAMAALFRNEPDGKRLLAMRSIYEELETVTDRCEDVANIVQGIVIKNS